MNIVVEDQAIRQGTKCKLMRCKIMNVAVNKNEAEKKGTQNPKSILKKKAVRFKETKRIPKTAEQQRNMPKLTKLPQVPTTDDGQ